MKINDQKITAEHFAFDGCHKIYILNSVSDKEEALERNYKILAIEKLNETWNNGCSLRFISSWDLETRFVLQGENAEFENFPNKDGEPDKDGEQDMSAYLITSYGEKFNCLGCDGYTIAKTRREAEQEMRTLYLETFGAAGTRAEFENAVDTVEYHCFKIAVTELDKILEHWSDIEADTDDSLYELLTETYSLDSLNDIYENVL